MKKEYHIHIHKNILIKAIILYSEYMPIKIIKIKKEIFRNGSSGDWRLPTQ
jgi:hypothetical protein